MSAYRTPIIAAIILFPLLAVLLTLPWLIYLYRTYGFFNWSKSLIMYSFVFYLMCALFLVLLPLPTSRDTCANQLPGVRHYSFVPFAFIRDILRGNGVRWSQPSTYIWLVRETAFLQAEFNFLLLLPFGMYLRYFLGDRRCWTRAFGLGLALSLFFEVTQGTGVYGIYNCPYRIFDVDDLILNSAGALAGFFVAPIILGLFPSQQSIEARGYQLVKDNVVLPVAQLLAVAIDILAIDLFRTVISLVLPPNRLQDFLYRSLGFFILLFLAPVFWQGRTIGTRIMRFRLVPGKTEMSFQSSLFVRMLALYLPVLVSEAPVVFSSVRFDMYSPFYPFLIWAQLASILGVILLRGILLIHIIVVILGKGRQFYFDFAAHLLPSRT